MAFVPVQIPPGMLLNSTEYGSKGRWVDGNLVRFWRGAVRPIGGWERADPDPEADDIFGTVRAIHTWRALTEQRWAALGSESGLWSYDGETFTDITPTGLGAGPASGGAAEGYGGGEYGTANYGDARAFAYRVLAPANWTMDNWGEQLVACANWDGVIYYWDPATAAAVPIEDPATGTEVPQLCASIFVTNERHLVAVGAGRYDGVDTWDADGRRVAWSDQEDYETWTPTVTNAAGDLQLQTDSLAVCGTPFNRENLIWTQSDVHLMQYLGPPYYYSLKRLAGNAGIVSSSAFAVTNRFVLWVAPDAIMLYDGAVKELSPEVSEWYRENLNDTARGKVAVGHNPRFDEIFIFFPEKGEPENTKYLLWNYEDNTWAKGDLPRSSWHVSEIFDSPLATRPAFQEGGDLPVSIPLFHERGWKAEGRGRATQVFVETSPIEIANGDRLVVARRFVHDTRPNEDEEDELTPSDALQVSFRHRLAPEASERTEGPYMIDTSRGYTDIRFTGRQVKMRFTQRRDENWALGTFRLEVVPGSGR